MSELSSSDWSETDASNNAAAPNGWPEGMNPSDVNNSARAMMGGLKRFWDRLNFAYTAGGGTTAYTLTPTVALAAYAQEIWTWKMPSTNAVDATMNISGLGARNIRILTGAGYANVPAGALPSGSFVMALYNTADSKLDVLSVAIGPVEGSGATFTSTDTGAGTGPVVDLYRNSASPADSDEIGEITFSGEDDGGNTTIYASLSGQIDDQTDATEDGRLNIKTMIAGTRATRGYVGHGLVVGSATGGDKGAGTINVATALYIGGNKSGGLVALTPIDLTGASQADIVLDTTNYRALQIFFDAVVVTSDGANLLARVSVDGGSNYLSTATYFHVRSVSDDSPAINAGGSATDTAIVIAGSVDSTTSQNLSGIADLIIGGAAAHATKLMFRGGYVATSGRIGNFNGYGSNSTTSQVNAVRFLPSTSTFASGFIYPYAVLK